LLFVKCIAVYRVCVHLFQPKGSSALLYSTCISPPKDDIIKNLMHAVSVVWYLDVKLELW